MKTELLRELYELHNRIEVAFFDLYTHYNALELNKKLYTDKEYYLDLGKKMYELNEARLELFYFTIRHIGHPVP